MRPLAICALLLAGCYAPDPTSGAYLCGEEDACPDGLSCECGQCVESPSEAACSFAITSPMAVQDKKLLTLSVPEHFQFPIHVAAFAKDGSAATGFSGSVKLSSTWGDLCVGTQGCVGTPDQVALAGGVGDATVQLNRETISPQTAVLRAELAGNVGTSGALRITVVAPTFTTDAAPIVAPLTVLPPTSYGIATGWAGGGSVIKRADGWHMFYIGAVGTRVGLGAAVSADGRTFTPDPTPIYQSDDTDPTKVGVPSAYDDGTTTHVYVGRQPAPVPAAIAGPLSLKNIEYKTIVELTSPSAGGAFSLNPTPLIDNTGADPDCTFCSAVDTPAVIADPNAALDGGGPTASLMFFSSFQIGGTSATPTPVATIVRASSGDGESFAVDPAPILQSIRDEAVLFSPRVLVDGTIFKMYYAFTPIAADATVIDPCSVRFHLGYATSSDGYFWVRSPQNGTAAADLGTTSIIVGAVLPVDGVDPSAGIAIYYSEMARVALIACLPNGIERAVRD